MLPSVSTALIAPSPALPEAWQGALVEITATSIRQNFSIPVSWSGSVMRRVAVRVAQCLRASQANAGDSFITNCHMWASRWRRRAETK